MGARKLLELLSKANEPVTDRNDLSEKIRTLVCEKGDPCVYCCDFVHCSVAIGSHACVLHKGVAYMELEVALSILISKCEKLKRVWKAKTPTLISTVASNIGRDSAPIVRSLTEWGKSLATFVASSLGEFVPLESGCTGGITSIVNGPACCLALLHNLRSSGHLFFHERKQFLGMLLDSGMTPKDAVEYMEKHMNGKSKKDCDYKYLESLLTFFVPKAENEKEEGEDFRSFRAKKSYNNSLYPELVSPASISCSTYIMHGRQDAHEAAASCCPYVSMGKEKIASLLRSQKLPQGDIEDIVGKIGKYPKAVCAVHFNKLCSLLTGAQQRNVPYLRITTCQDFMIAMVSTLKQQQQQQTANTKSI